MGHESLHPNWGECEWMIVIQADHSAILREGYNYGGHKEGRYRGHRE